MLSCQNTLEKELYFLYINKTIGAPSSLLGCSLYFVGQLQLQCQMQALLQKDHSRLVLFAVGLLQQRLSFLSDRFDILKQSVASVALTVYIELNYHIYEHFPPHHLMLLASNCGHGVSE